MTAVDTNILVRFLVCDDSVQAAQVRQAFLKAERERTAFFVPLLVLLETIWVLESAYSIPKPDLLATLTDLLRLPILRFEQREAIQATLATASSHPLDLPDALIAESARHSGCGTVLTFDRKAARTAPFQLLPTP
jgi:predicted nucleic-acid-binding protein